MLLSIVTGTYNRLPQLSQMMQSAETQLFRLDYEFVIVDGGSTDGTIEWLRTRSNVRLIEQHELVGAIKAFGAGARQATGQYVLMANDDIRFKPHAILSAIRHLEMTPTCAAVAFADNRTSRLHGDGTEFRTESMGAQKPDGTPTMVTYAQVGLFRRELGNQAGWWGDQDHIMKQARTYGGDNYLSSRLWEMGYTVDPVDGAVVIDDYKQDDALRAVNNTTGSNDSRLYYKRYPMGARLHATPNAYPVTPRLRILYAPVYESRYPMRRNLEYSIGHALKRYGHVIEVDYLNDPVDIVALCHRWQPDLMLTQIQGIGERFTVDHLRAIRQVAPNALIINWNGDAHERGLISPEMLALLQAVDLQTTVNAKVLPIYEREGIRAAYWQIAYKDALHEVEAPAHDILFQANWYAYRDPIFSALRRLQNDGLNVGMYGNHKLAIRSTHYNFSEQAALYRNARIVIGDTFPNTVGFVSNRVFQALANGAFLLQQHSPRLEDYTGLKAGVHYAQWQTVDDLPQQVKFWMHHADERKAIAQAGREYVRANFSADAQVDKLFHELLPRLYERA